MHLIGEQIAKLHAADIIHGDLTTSNMMIRMSSDSVPTAEMVGLPADPYDPKLTFPTI